MTTEPFPTTFAKLNMSVPSTSLFNKILLKWKTLRLPWRKRWLAGTDLVGNSFWYFRPTLSMPRPRRILQYNPQIPYSDIQISPQWHQWLRYTRPLPPTISEQQADSVRQRELKKLVHAADERWAAKPSVLDRPRGAEREGEGVKSLGALASEGKEETHPRVPQLTEQKKESPWKTKKGNPGEDWQPQAWTPGPSTR